MSVMITPENLRAETANSLTVIDFWAPWCGPCKMMQPVMRQLEAEFKGQIHFGAMNVSHHQKTAEKFTVMSIPSLVIFEHGRAHEKVTGYYPKTALATFLRKKIAEVRR